MPSAPVEACSSCDLEALRRSELCIENNHSLCASDGFVSRQGVLPGSGIIVPLAHRTSPFESRREEWDAMHETYSLDDGQLEVLGHLVAVINAAERVLGPFSKTLRQPSCCPTT